MYYLSHGYLNAQLILRYTHLDRLTSKMRPSFAVTVAMVQDRTWSPENVSGFLATLLAGAAVMGDVSHVCGKYVGLFVNLEAWLQLNAAAAAGSRHFVWICGAFK